MACIFRLAIAGLQLTKLHRDRVGSKGPYITQLESMLPSRPYLGQLCEILQQQENGITRFSLADLSPAASPQIQETTDLQQARRWIQQKSPVARFRVCVIENISPAFIDLVGSAWTLDGEFFVDHALGCRGDWLPSPVALGLRPRTGALLVPGRSAFLQCRRSRGRLR